MDAPTKSRLARRQAATAAALLVGYSGYYFCRSNLSVVAPLLVKEQAANGLTQETLGAIMSLGVLLYAAGKLVNGFLADALDGRRVFLFGMVASVVCTFVFGLGAGVAVFAAAWAVNRFVQSMGWSALVKIAAHWFAPSRQATVMGVLSMSYLLGDAAARLVLGLVLDGGAGRRGVFFASGVILAVIAAGNWLVLRSTPADAGLPEPEEPRPDFRPPSRADAEPGGPWKRLTILLASERLWQVCLICFGLTLIRETFNGWTPTYLVNVVGMRAGAAAVGSLVFPLAGAAAALAGGWLSDRCGGRHGRVMLPSLGMMVVVLATLGFVPLRGRPVEALLLLAAAAFFLVIPYSFCSGVLSIDLGGRRAGATASGVVDAAGYLGGAFSGYGIAAVATNYGWPAAFGVLAAAGVVTAALVGVYMVTPPDGRGRPAPALRTPARKGRRKHRV